MKDLRNKVNNSNILDMHDSLRADDQLHFYISCCEDRAGMSKELLETINTLTVREECVYLYEPIAIYLTPLDYTIPGKTLSISAMDDDLEPLGYKYIYVYE